MTYFADEVVAVTSGNIATLTRATFDNDPGSQKAGRAKITCYSANVAYRFNGTDPNTTTHEYHLLAANGEITVENYDDLVNLKFKLISGSTAAQLFVSYAA